MKGDIADDCTSTKTSKSASGMVSKSSDIPTSSSGSLTTAEFDVTMSNCKHFVNPNHHEVYLYETGSCQGMLYSNLVD